MKTSSKLTVALLATLVVGGSSAGSLFSSVLNAESSSSLGKAGAFFSALNLPDTSAPVSPASLSITEEVDIEEVDIVVVVAEPFPTPTLVTADLVTEIRALIQNPDLAALPEASPTPEISLVAEPSLTPEPESTVALELEVILASVPTPEPELTFTSVSTPELTELFIVEEPSSIEP